MEHRITIPAPRHTLSVLAPIALCRLPVPSSSQNQIQAVHQEQRNLKQSAGHTTTAKAGKRSTPTSLSISHSFLACQRKLSGLKNCSRCKSFGKKALQKPRSIRAFSMAVTKPRAMVEHSSPNPTNTAYTNVDPVLRQGAGRDPYALQSCRKTLLYGQLAQQIVTWAGQEWLRWFDRLAISRKRRKVSQREDGRAH